MAVGENKFLLFDETKVNMMDQAVYKSSTYRANGCVQGIAPSNLHNKLYHQVTTMVSAIAQVLANSGETVSDEDFSLLVSQLTSGLGNTRAWKPNTLYKVGEIAFPTDPRSGFLLECTVEGTTAATEPTWVSGQTIVDGTASWSVTNLKSSGESIGSIKPWLVTKIPAGWLDISTGALVSRATYPELWAWIQANAPLISDAEWQTQAGSQSSVGFFSTGDGSTTFRLPRILDYIRGGALADVGSWQGDAIRNITGTYAADDSNNFNSGAFSSSSSTLTTGNGASNGWLGSFDASRVVPTAEENRPKTIKMVYCIKAFGAATNQGMIDITALANSLNSKLDKVDVGMAIIYPNGGSEGSPANVSANTRYENNIPAGFENYNLLCVAEVLANGKWGETGWGTYDGAGALQGGYGVRSFLFDGKIITQVGTNSVIFGPSAYIGNPFGATLSLSTAPCRVKLFRIAKIGG